VDLKTVDDETTVLSGNVGNQMPNYMTLQKKEPHFKTNTPPPPPNSKTIKRLIKQKT
jgi:hypothetical protein